MPRTSNAADAAFRKTSEADRQAPGGEVLSFRPVKTRRLFEEVCDSIRAKVVSGELKAGDRLPPERELSEMLHVSRTALREALRSLEIAGIVHLKKGSKGGAFIADGGAGQVTRSFRDMLDFGHASLAVLLEARVMVMDVVVRAACERAKRDDITLLKANVADTIALTQAGRHEDRTLRAVAFSTLLANSTGNAVLSAILEAMAAVIRRFVVAAGPPPHDPLVKSRLRLIAQIEARDVEGASKTMRKYLERLNAHLLASSADHRAGS